VQLVAILEAGQVLAQSLHVLGHGLVEMAAAVVVAGEEVEGADADVGADVDSDAQIGPGSVVLAAEQLVHGQHVLGAVQSRGDLAAWRPHPAAVGVLAAAEQIAAEVATGRAVAAEHPPEGQVVAGLGDLRADQPRAAASEHRVSVAAGL